MSGAQSTLGMFNLRLIGFFEDLHESYPEEREIKQAIDALKMTKSINPRLILDLFMEFVSKPLKEHILTENEEFVLAFARNTIKNQFNEMSPALLIFDKHWPTMSDGNKDAIWKHLKVLCLLADRAKA
jgi:hypothetical protein